PFATLCDKLGMKTISRLRTRCREMLPSLPDALDTAESTARELHRTLHSIPRNVIAPFCECRRSDTMNPARSEFCYTAYISRSSEMDRVRYRVRDPRKVL